MSARQRGSALIVVVGAISAMTVPATVLLLGASLAYEIEAYTAEVQQARLLASAVRMQTERGLAAGVVALPERDAPITVRNGVVSGLALPVPIGRLPVPPAGSSWPPLSDQPPAGGAPFGIGSLVTLSLVVGPRGEVRGPDGVSGSGQPRLLDVEVRVWFRRAVTRDRWRYVIDDGTLQRLR